MGVAFKIPPFNHPDAAAIKAMDIYLSGGKSSLLQRVLVDEKKLANQINIYDMSAKDENLFIVFGVCNQGVSGEALRSEILALIEKAKKAKISDDDMLKIKNTLSSDLIYSLDSASKVAQMYGSYIVRGDLDALFRLEREIKSLDKSAVKKAMKTYLSLKSSTSIILLKENYD